jgi:hypothetical protein
MLVFRRLYTFTNAYVYVSLCYPAHTFIPTIYMYIYIYTPFFFLVLSLLIPSLSSLALHAWRVIRRLPRCVLRRPAICVSFVSTHSLCVHNALCPEVSHLQFHFVIGVTLTHQLFIDKPITISFYHFLFTIKYMYVHGRYTRGRVRRRHRGCGHWQGQEM